MIPFAITREGTPPGSAQWVLAVDPMGSRLLVTGDNGVLLWVAIADCRFVGFIEPGHPMPVMIVERPKITLPKDLLNGQWK